MYKAKVDQDLFEIEFSDDKGLKGSINGAFFEMDLVQNGGQHHLIHNHQSYTIELVNIDKAEKSCTLLVNNKEISIHVEDRFDSLLKSLGMDNMNSLKVDELKAPMPGLVLNILVQEGEQVSKGDGLLVLEAMKMENIIKSPTDATIKSIEVLKGNAVEKNEVLIKFE